MDKFLEIEQAIAAWTGGCNPDHVKVTVSDGLAIAVCPNLKAAHRLCCTAHTLKVPPRGVSHLEIWCHCNGVLLRHASIQLSDR